MLALMKYGYDYYEWDEEVLAWYKSLTIEQKINLKDCAKLIVGMTWEDMGKLFSFTERINILHNKLQLEGFTV